MLLQINPTLNNISEKCKVVFFQQAPKTANFSNIISYIEKEISNDRYINYYTYKNFLNAFNSNINHTLNKREFIKSEIKSINTIITQTLNTITNRIEIQKTIYDLILINKDRTEVIQQQFSHKYFNQKYIDCFIKILFAYDLIKYLCFLEGEPLKNIKPPQKQLTFKDLFEHPYNSDKKINEFKELLRNSGYINDSYSWEGITKNKNELAILYYYLKSLPGIIISGDDEPQIIAFYKEFGRVVYKDSKDKGTNGYCTIRGLKNPKHKETKEISTQKFSIWVK